MTFRFGTATAAALFLGLTLSLPAQEGTNLAVHVRPRSTTVELGTRLPLSLEFVNTGRTIFHIARVFGFGSDGINITAR